MSMNPKNLEDDIIALDLMIDSRINDIDENPELWENVISHSEETLEDLRDQRDKLALRLAICRSLDASQDNSTTTA